MASPKRPAWQIWLRRLFLVGILGFVIWRLSELGWGTLLANMPSSPFFYILQLASFLVLPLCEKVIFRIIWQQKMPGVIIAALRKRSLNNVVFGLSGDAFFFLWARGRVDRPSRQLVAGIKDNVILSGVATALFALIVLASLLLLTRDVVLSHLPDFGAYSLPAFILLAAVGGTVLWLLRSHVLWINQSRAGRVLLVHLLRVGTVMTLSALQWETGLPEGTALMWVTLVAMQLLISQIPLVPNRDLVFLAVVIQLASSTPVDPASLQAMFVTIALLSQILNYASLAITSMLPAAQVIGREQQP